MRIDGVRKAKLTRILEPLVIFAFLATLYAVYRLHSGGRMENTDLLEKADSYYNTILVYQGKDGLRRMEFGFNRKRYFECVHNPADPLELKQEYMQLMTLGVLYSPHPATALSIGMGGGKVSSYLLATLPQLQYTEVELDPDVVRLAKKYFDYKDTPRRTVVVNDGRRFLMGSPEHFDIIMLDAYRGPFVPFHLLTEEFYREVKKHLSPGGVVVQNIDSSTLLFDSTIATLHQEFEQTEYYSAGGNTVAIAYDGSRKTAEELGLRAKTLDDQYHFRYSLEDMLRGRAYPALKADAKPLTDDFAPVDTLNAIAIHNRKMDTSDR
jgi:spermidine synthase